MQLCNYAYYRTSEVTNLSAVSAKLSSHVDVNTFVIKIRIN